MIGWFRGYFLVKLRIHLFLFALLFFASIQCSPPLPTRAGGYRNTEIVARAIQGETKVLPICGNSSDCCSEAKSCRRTCSRIFGSSSERAREQCKALPQSMVTDLDEFIELLKYPDVFALERIQEGDLLLLLALDYGVWINIIKSYYQDKAREILIWIAKDKNLSRVLLELKPEVRNEILYEVLASAGDRTIVGPVEEGLSNKVSFDKSFFQLLILYGNQPGIQLTHDMLKADLCRADDLGQDISEQCLLRVYCREREDIDGAYVHSEELRNELANAIDDDEFFRYIVKNVLHSSVKVITIEPNLNNQVCSIVCSRNKRGCE